MTTRSGWTVNGKHFTVCLSTRMGCPIQTYHIDGKRTAFREWSLAFAEAKKTSPITTKTT